MKTLQECKDEVARNFNYPLWGNVINDLYEGGLSPELFSFYEREVDALYALQWKQEPYICDGKENRSPVEKPDFEKMAFNWPWLKNGIEINSKEDAMRLIFDLSTFIGNQVWNDYVLPLQARIKELEQGISVKDRLPEEDVIHLLYRREWVKGKRVVVGGNTLWHYEGERLYTYEAPTRWMPLPQPPKAEIDRLKG